jgi:hypothetical protein
LHGKNESSIREVMKSKENIRASFSVAPQTAKVTATVRDKVLMKVEKVLNFWVEDMNRKRVPVDGKVLQQESLNLYEDSQKKKWNGRGHQTSYSRGWLHRLRNRFNLKSIKIKGEAASADEEGAATFPAELKNYQGKKIQS